MRDMPSPPVRGLRGQALLGALDQALLALAHFALGIVVARLGGPVALGAFAFAYAVVVLVNMLHAAALAEVYSVDAEAGGGERDYGATPILVVTSALYLVCAAAITLAGMAFPELRGATANPPFHAALFFSTLYWSVKPYFYRRARPVRVLAATGVYAAVMLASALLLLRFGGAQAQPLWAIAIGAALASWLLLRELRPVDAGYAASLRKYLRASFVYARWAVPAAVLIWINSNGYVFLMPLFGQTEQTGGLRAIINLVAPVNTLLVGACAALLPALAGLRRRVGRKAYVRAVHGLALTAAILAAMVAGAVMSFSEGLLGFVYGEAYVAYASALRAAVVLPVLWAVASVYRAGIRAQAKSRDLFMVYAFALFPFGIGLLLWLAPQGATAAIGGMLGTQVLVVAGFLYRFTHAKDESTP